MRRAVALAALLLVASGCVKAPPAPPASVRTIAVFPVCNRTGDELLISGGSLLEKYVFHTERVTVPEVMAAEARTLLEGAGYGLVPPATIDAATGGRSPLSAKEAAATATAHDLAGDVLFIDLRQWTPDLAGGPASILVSVRIDLVDPGSGRTIWSADRPLRPVPTAGTINFADAYWVAARSVIRDMLAPFAARSSA